MKPGPVNTYFAHTLLRENVRARREAQGIVGLWPSFATQHPRVFRGQHRGRDGFRPSLRCSPLTEAYSAARSLPYAGWNPSPSRAAK